MKTYNIEFENFDQLEKFIQHNKEINKSKEILVQIFSGQLDVAFLEKLVKYIKNKIPKAKIIGSTTDGEIIDDSVRTQSTVVSITTFEKSTLSIDYIDDNLSLGDSYLLGERISLKLREKNSKVFIIFGDGLHTNGEEFIKGVLHESPNVIVAGGLAGDNATFTNTYLICDDKIINIGAVGVSINSDTLMVNNDYSFAWENIGREFIVNRSDKNRVYEIDNITPVELYKKYLGDEVANLLPSIGIEFPLVIQDDEVKVARAVLSKNDDGSLVFAGNIPEGSRVKFGVGNVNHIINDTKEMALNSSQFGSEAIFIYSCMARRRFLGTQANLDLKYLSKIAPISGFFTYGEFFTYKTKPKFLNESMTILGLSENSEKPVQIEFDLYKLNSSHMTTLQALSHLVNITSKELDQINSSLHTKVVSEIEKNLEYEKKVFDSMKMASLGDMIANIAHQWRQPLSVITTSASAMQINKDLGMLDDVLFSKYTDMMIAQSMYLSDTINTFRDFIQEEHKLCDVILQHEIENTLKILGVVLKDNDIELIKDLDHSNPIALKLVMGELSQVIINIINNAKDSLKELQKEDKWIKLDLYSTDNKCIITIEDNGSGIPENILPKIFDQNFTTKHKSVGTGIGLYMSYNIVTKHMNGSLYAKNTHNGAKFFIELPL